MKELVLVVALSMFLHDVAFGQHLISNTRVETSGDSAIIYIEAAFDYGSSTACPFLQGYALEHIDTIKIDLFYNVDGAWPGSGFCIARDTIYLPDLDTDIITLIPNQFYGIDTLFNQAEYYYDFSVISSVPDLITEEISLYPNPATEAVNVNFNGTRAENTSIELQDAFGRVVKREIALSNQEEIQITVSEFPTGFYYCRVKQKEKVQLLKFMKQ